MTGQQYTAIDPYGGANQPSYDWRSWRTKGAWEQWKILPRAFPYLRPYRGLYVIVFIFTLLGSVIALAEPWPLAVMIDSVLDGRKPAGFLSGIFGADPDPYRLLVFIVIAGFLITVVGHGMTVLNDYFSARLEQNMILDLRSELFEHTAKLSLTFHDERHTGQLMGLINMQANALGAIVMAFPPILQNFLTLTGMLAIALLIDWQVTLIALVAIPFIYYALGLYGTRIVPRIKQVMNLEWGSLSIVYEAMSMLRVIVTFGREKYEYRRFRNQGETAVDARVKLTVRQTLFALAVTAATAGGTALVLGFGASHVLSGDITKGELLVLIAYIAAVYAPLEQISTTVGDLNQHLVFLNATFALLDKEPEVVESPHAVDIGRARGDIELDDVSFTYEKREATVKNVSFKSAAGERIAVVGPTGAGKTTLVSLIVRFYDAHDGRILIDGVETRDMKLSNLRENVSVVLQEPLLFSGTIAENIRYGRLDALAEDVVQAARRANAHDFIMSLPNGYETELGEGAHQLSGGERQRICVARAFIKDAPILILDEPTSSIDSKTESVILDALEELMEGRTSIMIAHRLSTIRDADKILVMNHGELVEQGSHYELLALGGLYSQLYEAQTRIHSRSRSEGGAGYEGQLIDSISQEVGDRLYASRGNGEPGPATEALPPGDEAPPPRQLEPAPAGQKPPAEPVPREPARPAANGDGVPVAANGAGNGHRGTTVKIYGERRGELHCDFCGRTLLKGEIAEPFIAPLGKRQRKTVDGNDDTLLALRRMQGGTQQQMLVCELCSSLAESAGWSPLPLVGGRR